MLGKRLFGGVMPNPVAAHALNSVPYKTTGRAVCSRYVRSLYRELEQGKKKTERGPIGDEWLRVTDELVGT